MRRGVLSGIQAQAELQLWNRNQHGQHQQHWQTAYCRQELEGAEASKHSFSTVVQHELMLNSFRQLRFITIVFYLSLNDM